MFFIEIGGAGGGGFGPALGLLDGLSPSPPPECPHFKRDEPPLSRSSSLLPKEGRLKVAPDRVVPAILFKACKARVAI